MTIPNGQVDIWLRNRPNDPGRPIMLTIETAGEFSEAHLTRSDARLLAKALLSRADSKDVQPWNHTANARNQGTDAPRITP